MIKKRSVLDNDQDKNLMKKFDISEDSMNSLEKFKWERFGWGTEIMLYDSSESNERGVLRVVGLCAIDHPQHSEPFAKDLLLRAMPGNAPKEVVFIWPKDHQGNGSYIQLNNHKIYLAEFIYEDVRG